MPPILSLGRSQATPYTTPTPSGEEVATPWRSQDSILIRLVSSDAADRDFPVLAVLQCAPDGLCCQFHQPSRWAGRARAQGWSSESRGCCPESAGKAAPPCPALGLLCPAECGCVCTHVWQCAQYVGVGCVHVGALEPTVPLPQPSSVIPGSWILLTPHPWSPKRCQAQTGFRDPHFWQVLPCQVEGAVFGGGGQWGAANPRTPGLGPLARPDLSVVTGAGPAAVPR